MKRYFTEIGRSLLRFAIWSLDICQISKIRDFQETKGLGKSAKKADKPIFCDKVTIRGGWSEKEQKFCLHSCAHLSSLAVNDFYTGRHSREKRYSIFHLDCVGGNSIHSLNIQLR